MNHSKLNKPESLSNTLFSLEAWFRFVLSHRRSLLAVCLLISCASAYVVSRAEVSSSLQDMMFEDSDELRNIEKRIAKFGSNDSFIIAFNDDAPLSLASLKRLENVVDRIQKIPEIAQVHSLLSAKRISFTGLGISVENYADLARKDPTQSSALLDELRKDPLASLSISKNGQHTAVFIEPKFNLEQDGQRFLEIWKECEAAFLGEGFKKEALHHIGGPAVMSEILNQTLYNIQVLFPIVAFLLMLVVYALFRQFAPVAVTLLAAVLAALWTAAFATLLDGRLTIFLSIAPPVVLIVAFSDVIHLWSAYLVELRRGIDHEDAILASACEVGKACLYTSLTTLVGFLCLSLTPIPSFRQLGVSLGFGVAIALLLAMTLVPVVLSYMRPPATRNTKTSDDILNRILGLLSSWSQKQPKLIVVAFLAIFVFGLYGFSQMNIEADMLKRLSADNVINVDRRYFEKNFSGTNTLGAYLDPPTTKSLSDPEYLESIAKLQESIDQLPQVSDSYSLVKFADIIHKRLGGKGKPNGKQYVQYLTMFRALPKNQMRRFVDWESGSLRVYTRLTVTGFAETFETAKQIKGLPSPAKVVTSSGTYFAGKWLDQVLNGQKQGLGLSLIFVTLMLIIAFGSVRNALWSMIPNIFPLVVMMGTIGLAWDHVDSDTLIVAMMAIGIGVDDTLHFVMRYQIEARKPGATISRALDHSFQFAGRGIVMTTIVLVVGFLPFALSDYYSIRMLGTLLPSVLLLALFADVLLVPALIQARWIYVGPYNEMSKKDTSPDSHSG